MTDSRYVKEPKPARAGWTHPDIEHLDGVPWFEAPVPRRIHRCWPQTKAWMGFEQVFRCACGSLRNPRFRHPMWVDRNSRKRGESVPEPGSYIERKAAHVARLDAVFT